MNEDRVEGRARASLALAAAHFVQEAMRLAEDEVVVNRRGLESALNHANEVLRDLEHKALSRPTLHPAVYLRAAQSLRAAAAIAHHAAKVAPPQGTLRPVASGAKAGAGKRPRALGTL